MKKYIIFFLVFLINLFTTELQALKRDYDFWQHPHCLEHLSLWELKHLQITQDLAKLIPAIGKQCIYDEDIRTEEKFYCPNRSIYQGYVDYGYAKYVAHLRRHIEYCQKNHDCICFWPEYSLEAAQISDSAYLLFRDLLTTTALSELLNSPDDQFEFISTSTDYFNLHELTISFIATQLHFIDYYIVCKDIENYSISKYSDNEVAKIKDKLDDILEVLYQKFFALNTLCYKKHPNSEVDQEIRFMKFLVKDISGFDNTNVSLSYQPPAQKSYDICNFIMDNLQSTNTSMLLENKNTNNNYKTKAQDLNLNNFPVVHSVTPITCSHQSDIFLEQGTLLNDFLFYKEAIPVLSQSIQINPYNRNAYIERAMAYFETNQLALALKDYESAKKLTIPPFKSSSLKFLMTTTNFIPENKAEFSKGMIFGVIDGAKESTVEFVPSVFNCCRGILNGLWAFVCSPIEISQELVSTAYATGEFIFSHSTHECFQYIVPELKELSLSWDKLNDYSRGHLIGFIIGKYGIDIFAPGATIKGVNKVRALKRASIMCTLESCIASQVKQAKILEESTKRAVLRDKLINNSAKKGKILIKSSNVKHHVMQPKHAWDKILKLSGNIEVDFKNVSLLLEKESILSDKYYLRSRKFFQEKIIRSDYQKTVKGHTIHAVFETYTELNQTYLQDAWVITK